MSFRPVEAAFFWRYFESPFRAAYGRLPGSTKYTKDYLQCSGDQWTALDRILGRSAGEKVSVEYRWPGGTRTGELRKATDDRAQLAWPTSDAPTPWKVGDPADPAIVMPGDPRYTNEGDADAELARIQALGLEPWVVAVKLYGEERVLYPRMYLGQATAGQRARSTERLPQAVRAAMAALKGNVAGGFVTFGQLRAPELVGRIVETLNRDPNVLLVGPPGTGKTVAMEDLRSLFDGMNVAGFDPDRWEEEWTPDLLPEARGRKSVSLVFHPSYTYEDFVAGLVPRTTGGVFTLVARPGPLLSLAHWSSDSGRCALLVLDEFNRGPAAAIFGDTLALLDAAKRDDSSAGRQGASIQRPHPRESMQVAGDYANHNGVDIQADVRLPASLWILAGLNSTDRSVAPLDAALRRRFAILNVDPDYDVLARRFGIPVPPLPSPFVPSAAVPENWTAEDAKQLAVRLLWVMNDRIKLILGRDFLLGHSLLWPVVGSSAEGVLRALCRAFDERIVATLRLTFFDQDEALAAVLKAGPPPIGLGVVAAGQGRIARWVTPPPELEAVAAPRLEVHETITMPWLNAARALVALL